MDGNEQAFSSLPHIGLTKREYFAAQCMMGMLGNSEDGIPPKGADWFSHMASQSVRYADALISALSAE